MANLEMSFHNKVSLVKSAFRLLTGVTLVIASINGYVTVAGLFLIVAEVLGIVEEVS